jgi:hypothetical protein
VAGSDERPEWLARYDGLSLDEVLAVAEEESRLVRVLRPDDAMTLEWRPDRLDVFLDDAGEVRRVDFG